MANKFKNGLLLLSNLPCRNSLNTILQEASEHVQKNLFIDLVINPPLKKDLSLHAYNELVKCVYARPQDTCQNLNVHVLLPPANTLQNGSRRQLSEILNVCITDESSRNVLNDIEISVQKKFIFEEFSMRYINVRYSPIDFTSKYIELKKSYPGVVIGGTFDHMHDGHKLLISTALLLADEKITVGVADGRLLEKKILKELIEPVDLRIHNVLQMIENYKPALKTKVVPLLDPCGPSGTDDDLQLLVVSEETIKGGPIVNETRKNNDLDELDILSIDLVGADSNDLSTSLNAEGKLSSSAQRVRELGVIRKQSNSEKQDGRCYIIGMTGGIASGKSSVVKRIEKLGAYTIDCDKLGHEAYLPGRTAYKSIIEYFGKDILNEDGTVNRKKLGPIVFSDPKKLEKLNEIVWPEIREMRREIIRKVEAEGKYDVIVFEGAVLFESGWDIDANEVWCCVISNDEAVQRIIRRNGLSAEQAKSRLMSQMSNEERVKRSHVILSTLWEEEFTQKQVEKAWKLLCDRIHVGVKKQSSL